MLKEEFESRIGKRVTMDTFREYEKMYLAIDADKDAFVKLLNLDAIPEDPAVKEAREEAERMKAEQIEKINELKRDLKNYQGNVEYYKEFDRPQAAYYRELVKMTREKLREEREWLRLGFLDDQQREFITA